MCFSKPFVLLIFTSVLSFQMFGQSDSNKEAQRLREILMPYFIPVEHDTAFLKNNEKKINLGRHLFYDQRLSSSGTISCNSCHDLQNYGTNGTFYLESKDKETVFRDIPTLYNVSTLSMLNTDGRYDVISDKISSSFSSIYEMNVKDKHEVVERLKSMDGYKSLFQSAFPNDNEVISFDNIVNALQTFIEGLRTPAPIDKFLNGKDKALTKAQIEGGHVFNSKSCYSCHTGSNFGGQMIQKLGIAEDWPNQKDLGYYRVKKLSAYKMFFRVAPLRNVDRTSPYFHDGSSSILWKAVQLMGRHERGLRISKEDAIKIEEFLKSLTGEIPLDYIKKPKELLN